MAAASSLAIHQYHLSADKIILASAGYNYYPCVHLSVDKRRYDQVYIEAGLTMGTSGPWSPVSPALSISPHHTYCQFSANFRHLFLLSPRHLFHKCGAEPEVRSSPQFTALQRRPNLNPNLNPGLIL